MHFEPHEKEDFSVRILCTFSSFFLLLLFFLLVFGVWHKKCPMAADESHMSREFTHNFHEAFPVLALVSII